MEWTDTTLAYNAWLRPQLGFGPLLWRELGEHVTVVRVGFTTAMTCGADVTHRRVQRGVPRRCGLQLLG